ncbi:UNVERIFIED_CONTAM: ERI1 exoribonuclease 2 [Sesamum calycinum]|uniref:ERI1 exoribonuclease 2 n=1 Tax=Sesamum calycinum TaxID=2727403 RepID=A0AAW2T0R0_9LAMI
MPPKQGLPCTLQNNTTYVEGFPKIQSGLGARPCGNVINQDCLGSSEPLESSEECTQRPIYHHDFGSWSANPDSKSVSLGQLNAFRGQLNPFAVNYRLQKNPHPQEIIEFPSVIVSSITGQLEACFQTYVRPTCNQILSDFCKDLTGIQQIQVDRGVTLSEALLRHDKWLEKKGIKNTNFAVVTWSNWDCRVMLESECRYKKIRKPPYFNRWINLRVPFHEVFGGVRCNLKEAVEKAGLAWQGRAHCGLDDAKNCPPTCLDYA